MSDGIEEFMQPTGPENEKDHGLDPVLQPVGAFLSCLSLAVHHFHTYPARSPVCAKAIQKAHAALNQVQDRDQVDLRVLPEELLVDEEPVKGIRAVIVGLAQRLHRADVVALTIHCDASAGELSLFCDELVKRNGRAEEIEGMADALLRVDVDRIKVTVAQRMEVVDTGGLSADREDLIGFEQSRRKALKGEGTVTGHLFSPGTGWVRLDPSSKLREVSIADLALLVDDPRGLARMFVRLAGDMEGAGKTDDEIFVHKFNEIARLYNSLDPDVIEPIFKNLAHAVLGLEATFRHQVIWNSALPGLLDRSAGGEVLKYFPDADLAESLSLLLDLDMAEPEVLSVALDRLGLSEERRTSVGGLLEKIFAQRSDDQDSAADPLAGILDERTHGNVDPENRGESDFREYAAFDLSLDTTVSERLSEIAKDIAGTDGVGESFFFRCNLLGISTNPETAEKILAGLHTLLRDRESKEQLSTLACWLGEIARIRKRLLEDEPDTEALVSGMLQAFCTPEFITRLVSREDPKETENGNRIDEIFGSLGPAATSSAVKVLERTRSQSLRKGLVRVLGEHVADFNPTLLDNLDKKEWFVVRDLLTVLGNAGRGFEGRIAGFIDHDDKRVAKEALFSLAKIGTPKAASMLAKALQHRSREIRTVAEQALWRLPPGTAASRLKALLGRKAFLTRHPVLSRRLLERAAEQCPDTLEEMTKPLRSRVFRFWRPGQVRLGAAAWKLARRERGKS